MAFSIGPVAGSFRWDFVHHTTLALLQAGSENKNYFYLFAAHLPACSRILSIFHLHGQHSGEQQGDRERAAGTLQHLHDIDENNCP